MQLPLFLGVQRIIKSLVAHTPFVTHMMIADQWYKPWAQRRKTSSARMPAALRRASQAL